MQKHDHWKPTVIARCPHATIVKQPRGADQHGDPSPIFCVTCGADMPYEHVAGGLALPDDVAEQLRFGFDDAPA